MARISEFEQRGQDTLEVAITQAEFDRLGSATDPFELRVTILDAAGAEDGSFLLSTDPADWTLDPDTNEYILIEPIIGFGNHRTNWDGLVLSSVNATGLDTVEMALMVAPFDEPVDADGPLATQVTAATHIPVGTPLWLIDQSNVVGTGNGATLLFNAPDINTPIVSRVDDLGTSGTGPVCFTKGTLIDCANGPVPIENLRTGDLVRTEQNGLQPIRWIGTTSYSFTELNADARRRPVRISAGALGSRLPIRDILLSRQHRIVARSGIVKRLSGHDAVLVAVHRLAKMKKVSNVLPKRGIQYFHIMFDRHEIVTAEGLLAESLLLGDEAKFLLRTRDILRLESREIRAFERSALPIPGNALQNEIVCQHQLEQTQLIAPKGQVGLQSVG